MIGKLVIFLLVCIGIPCLVKSVACNKQGNPGSELPDEGEGKMLEETREEREGNLLNGTPEINDCAFISEIPDTDTEALISEKLVEWKFYMEADNTSVYYIYQDNQERTEVFSSGVFLFVNGRPTEFNVLLYNDCMMVPKEALEILQDDMSEFQDKLETIEDNVYINLQDISDTGRYRTGSSDYFTGYHLIFAWIDKKDCILKAQYSLEEGKQKVFDHFMKCLWHEVDNQYLEYVGGAPSIDDFRCIAEIGSYSIITMPTIKAGFEQFEAVFNLATANIFYISESGGALTTF